MKKLLLLSVAISFLVSCYYDNASELYPAAGLNLNCDTVNVTYTKNIEPLFISNCGANNSCHSTSMAEGGVILDTYANAILVDNTLMIGCVEHTSGYSPMPPVGKISDCGINQLKLWIQNGKLQ